MNIAVLGAGSVGLALTAHLSRHGHHVKLWNRTESNIKKIIKTGKIKVKGKLNFEIKVFKASSDINEIIDDVKIVFVTVQTNYHKDIAVLSAPLLKNDMLVVLIPGATLGVFEFADVLKEKSVKLPIIAETLTSLYTCRKEEENSVLLIEIKKYDIISTADGSKNRKIIELLPKCLQPYFKFSDSVIQTSLGNVNMVLHCIPSLLNAGRIEDKNSDFLFYIDGITPSVAAMIEKLDEERVTAAQNMGYNLDSISDWFKKSYNVIGDNLYEIIQSNKAYLNVYAQTELNHRYLFEDVATGLVPLEQIGLALGLYMPVTKLVIDLSECLLNFDFRSYGRRLSEHTLQELIKFKNSNQNIQI